MERNNISKAAKTLPKFLPKMEILDMLNRPKNEGKKFSYRNYIILRVLWETGMRANEIVNLRKRDITEKTIMVREGKGRRDRMIPLKPELHGLLGLFSDRLTPRDNLFD